MSVPIILVPYLLVARRTSVSVYDTHIARKTFFGSKMVTWKNISKVLIAEDAKGRITAIRIWPARGRPMQIPDGHCIDAVRKLIEKKLPRGVPLNTVRYKLTPRSPSVYVPVVVLLHLLGALFFFEVAV